MAASGVHQQSPPELGNQLHDDPFLRQQLQRLIPPVHLDSVTRDLDRFGWDVATTIKDMGRQAELEPPSLVKYDAWGRRQDQVATCEGWKGQKAVSAREGLVGLAYERHQGEASRVVQAAKLYLYGASSGLFNCPLAMTDGAARLCEVLRSRHPELGEAFSHLTSRDPGTFWTSGQWMTEKAGGSDVATGTQTLAVPEVAGSGGIGAWHRLTGYKWFTSAADGEMAMALARELDSSGRPEPGNRGLSLFYVPIVRDDQGCPQGFEVVRLKDKLGTKQLPTAELALDGLRALKISEMGRGVPLIATMVNITRYHNACAATSLMRRITALAQDYARRRRAFGRLLIEQPLALRTLSWMTQQCEACLAFTLEVARLLGRGEPGSASPAEASLLRTLTPLAKLFTAKAAVAVASEGVEFFGGVGYVESSGLPGILRDAQVLPIWEGTTNVLSLDLLRALGADARAGDAFLLEARRRAARAADSAGVRLGDGSGAGEGFEESAQLPAGRTAQEVVRCAAATIVAALDALEVTLRSVLRSGPAGDEAQVGARDLAMAMARAFVAVLLLEHAAGTGSARDTLAVEEWCRHRLPLHPGTGVMETRPSAAMQLQTAALLARVGEVPSSPRARF